MVSETDRGIELRNWNFFLVEVELHCFYLPGCIGTIFIAEWCLFRGI